jgi:hypothetical protein
MARRSRGGGAAETSDEAVYLGIAVRNAGSGIAVLHGWSFSDRRLGTEPHARLDAFHTLTRDLYIAPNDVGFWQGAFRDPALPEFAAARAAIDARQEVTVDVLYGDHEGGQRVITRFALMPRDDGGWMAIASRHWNIDRADPR